MTREMTDKIASYALDIVIVISLTVLAAVGKIDAMIVVGVCGPLLGARVAGLAKPGDGKPPTIPPSATLLLLAGLSRLFTRGTSA